MKWLLLLTVYLLLFVRCGPDTNIFTLYPWIHQFCNNRANSDQIRPITFPDVSPNEIANQPDANFSMAAGDFLEIYTDPGKYSECYVVIREKPACSHELPFEGTK